jgi:hypothetical protein
MRKLKPSKPTFTLYRYPNIANQKAGIGEYVGALVVPGISSGADRVYSIEANVSEYDKPDGTKGRYFHGTVTGGQDVMRSMLRGAKGERAPPADLLALLEDVPFDDPIPNFAAEAAGAASGAEDGE